jgi:hypothetical protein
MKRVPQMNNGGKVHSIAVASKIGWRTFLEKHT